MLLDEAKPEVLIIEDSKFFASRIEKELDKRMVLTTHHAETLSAANAVINDLNNTISAIILDLGLPDSNREESLEFAKQINIPVIVYTGTFSNELGDMLRSYNIVDYVIKDNPGSLKYLVDIVHRILNNTEYQALVVDDSKTSRTMVSKLLKQYQLQTLEAEDGEKALELLKENPNTRLVITDFNMPEMNGFELASRIRTFKSSHELAIIGISSSTDSSISIRFLKSGANDFINKPFVPEEFFCRVSQNLSYIEMFENLRNAADTDYLTKLHNRRYFYNSVGQLLDKKAPETQCAIAILDIDHFKNINDTYGHDAGDAILKQISKLLSIQLSISHFVVNKGFDQNAPHSDSVLARFGGEEFCLFLSNTDETTSLNLCEKIRQAIEKLTIYVEDHAINITVSIGLNVSTDTDIEKLINAADKHLYEVKNTGRNRVSIVR